MIYQNMKTLQKTWDDLSGKTKEKADIERRKAKLDLIIQQLNEEKALYAKLMKDVVNMTSGFLVY